MADLKRGKKTTSKKKPAVANNIKDYSQDPFFVKKKRKGKGDN
jgi:hypothetical protein